MQIKFLPARNFVFQSFRNFVSMLPLVLDLSPLISCPLAAPSDFCQDAYMKQFFLGYLLSALIIPTLSMAQTAQLTEQLGKTVLYGDLALSPDGSHVTWVQSTAATTSKQTYIQATSGNSSATLVNLEAAGRENRCRPGLVARLQNRRSPFHRRRERAETTLVGKCRWLQSSKT